MEPYSHGYQGYWLSFYGLTVKIVSKVLPGEIAGATQLTTHQPASRSRPGVHRRPSVHDGSSLVGARPRRPRSGAPGASSGAVPKKSRGSLLPSPAGGRLGLRLPRSRTGFSAGSWVKPRFRRDTLHRSRLV